MNIVICGFYYPFTEELLVYYQDLVKVGGLFSSRAGMSHLKPSTPLLKPAHQLQTPQVRGPS